MSPNAQNDGKLFSPQEAGPSIKRTKTSDDSGLDMDNAAENGGGDSVNDGGTSEIELVFRPHPTLMEKDDGHNRQARKKPLGMGVSVVGRATYVGGGQLKEGPC